MSDTNTAGSANPAQEVTQESMFDEMTGGASTALVPVQPQDLEPPETDLSLTNRHYSTADPQFGRDEVMVPRLRLAQGLTAEVQSASARPGQYVLTGFEPFDEVKLTPVMFSRARELRTSDLTVLCQSSDAIQGVGDPGGVCAQCPKSQWTETAAGKNQPTKRNPPECVFIYSYLCWSHTHQALVAVEFKRTATNTAKLLNTMIATKGLGHFAVKLTAMSQKGPKGTFFIPQASPTAMTDDEHTQAISVIPAI